MSEAEVLYILAAIGMTNDVVVDTWLRGNDYNSDESLKGYPLYEQLAEELGKKGLLK